LLPVTVLGVALVLVLVVPVALLETVAVVPVEVVAPVTKILDSELGSCWYRGCASRITRYWLDCA
jgi:hypothetical protein